MAHGFPGDLLEEFFYVFEFFGKGFLRGDLGHIRMVISVVADDVSFFHHSFGQIRAGLQKVAYHEKSSHSLMLFQGI